MNVQEFVARHGAGPIRPFEDIREDWRRSSNRRVVDDFLGTEVHAGLTIGDAFIGDGLRDQISPDLLRACSDLMGDKASSYHEVRQILLEKLDNGDNSVIGFILKLQGQVGENHFIDQARTLGLNARLADSGSQQAWDVAIDHPDGTTEYIQVKTYTDADGVIAHIRQANESVLAGEVLDGGTVVSNLSLAVPANIADRVVERLAAEPALSSIKIYPMDISATDASGVVQEAFQNVGPEALQHLLGQIAGPLIAASAVAALVSALMVRKRVIETSEAIERALETTSLTAAGLSISIAMESALSSLTYLATPAAVVAGITGRLVVRRWYYARRDLLSNLRSEIEGLRRLLDAMTLDANSVHARHA